MDFAGKTAVVTGASSGMGRSLAVLLSRRGCHVAACDVSREALDETRRLCAFEEVRVSVHECDVSDDVAVQRLREEVETAHGETTSLLFNNAGILGPFGFIDVAKETWDKILNVNLHGVVGMTRTFLPTIVKQDKGYVVNTSSFHGYSVFPLLHGGTPHSAYMTSKFALRGFTESLMVDMRKTHPHVGVAVVHPGHIGTKIVSNTVPGDVLFANTAPISAEEAAAMILDGVAAGSTRIIVGEDARVVDWAVRLFPRGAYSAVGEKVTRRWMSIANWIGVRSGVPLGSYSLPLAAVAGGAIAVPLISSLFFNSGACLSVPI
jgi:NAD(P)-dependent dehydrogenase (short-subunit alcohol dehydrogenase family)